jgi:hypothetical protein
MKLKDPGRPTHRVYFDCYGWKPIYSERTINRGKNKGKIEVIFKPRTGPDGYQKMKFKPEEFRKEPILH